MILDTQKAIFVHIPRTAGTSIETSLCGHSITDPHFSNVWPKWSGPILRYGDEKFSKYFKFSIVRNPWDRLVSIYHYYKEGGNQRSEDKAIQKKWSGTFKEFVYNLDYWATHSQVDCQLANQADYLYDDDKLIVDFIGRFEKLNLYYNQLCKRLNIQRPLLKLNASTHKPYEKYYSKNTMEIVGKWFEKDIVFFDYRFTTKKQPLFAGPWIGEFGFELMKWQSFVRAASRGYEKVTVASRPDRQFLYQDFCDEFIPIDVKGTPDSFVIKEEEIKTDLPSTYKNKGYDVLLPTRRFVKKISSKNFKPFVGFIKFGNFNLDETYDILIHARFREHRDEDNWPFENWKLLTKSLNYRMASIGTKKEALHIDNTIDLRGIGLEQLADVMASSKLIIGPSSGPMHFASLCGLPHLVWGGTTGGWDSKPRYLKSWNPFDTKVVFYDGENWQPEVNSILELTKNIMEDGFDNRQ